MDTLSVVVLGGALAILIASLRLSSGRHFNLPPGPKGDFATGNLHVMLSKYQWMKYAEWSKTFGDIIYFTIVGRPVIVLNKFEHAHELLDKHSASYSDRPPMDYIVKMYLVSYPSNSEPIDWSICRVRFRSATFMPYGDTWRLYRRLMQQYLNPRAVLALRPMQTKCVHDLLQDLLTEPNDFWRNIKRFAASAVLSATYGYQVKPKDDPIMNLHEHSESAIGLRGPYGTMAADLFPFLQYIPSFLPGASFKRRALKARVVAQEISDYPYKIVQEQRITGTAVPCLLTYMLDGYEQQGIDDKERFEAIKNVCGAMYRGGVGSTSTVIYTFFLAMVLYPEFAKKAQNDLDAVLGGERLPTFDEQESLPYINCILKECLRCVVLCLLYPLNRARQNIRWNPPFPLAIAHRAMRDGELEGKYIPKNSMIMPNVWRMMHDERNYDDPMTFNPDRFIESGKVASSILDPRMAVFGFGRRVCPGRHFAEADIWLTMASILTVFNILPALDEKGCEIIPAPEFTSGLNSRPMEFACHIVPRSDKAASLVTSARDART
ncbi:cytochrome P450 [Fomitiporia mediterranea MF3/22]|uniref:cytochrome P450 n=1 Tax=Fomitiporia mediterranea (strain MF3/22) TaxID=694068 RepID=UPI00044092DB|nr:cytochrome P450 [Fomitiporia mediterranea MF3/22]EJD04922.1 cytochrome P450 [Fomitiporia mediterranea MF3/22]